MSTVTRPDPSRVIICTEQRNRHAPRSSCAHHRDFPEIEAEGDMPKDAAEQLAVRRTSAPDNVGSDYHRAQIARAIADVQEFVKREY